MLTLRRCIASAVQGFPCELWVEVFVGELHLEIPNSTIWNRKMFVSKIEDNQYFIYRYFYIYKTSNILKPSNYLRITTTYYVHGYKYIRIQ